MILDIARQSKILKFCTHERPYTSPPRASYAVSPRGFRIKMTARYKLSFIMSFLSSLTSASILLHPSAIVANSGVHPWGVSLRATIAIACDSVHEIPTPVQSSEWASRVTLMMMMMIMIIIMIMIIMMIIIIIIIIIITNNYNNNNNDNNGNNNDDNDNNDIIMMK